MSNGKRWTDSPGLTPFGVFYPSWDEDEYEKQIVGPLRQMLGKEGASDEAIEDALKETRQIWSIILTECIQHGVAMAIGEARAFGYMRWNNDDVERWQMVEKTANVTKELSFKRMASFANIRKPKRGQHKTSIRSVEDLIQARYEKEWAKEDKSEALQYLKERVIQVIETLCRNGQRVSFRRVAGGMEGFTDTYDKDEDFNNARQRLTRQIKGLTEEKKATELFKQWKKEALEKRKFGTGKS